MGGWGAGAAMALVRVGPGGGACVAEGSGWMSGAIQSDRHMCWCAGVPQGWCQESSRRSTHHHHILSDFGDILST